MTPNTSIPYNIIFSSYVSTMNQYNELHIYIHIIAILIDKYQTYLKVKRFVKYTSFQSYKWCCISVAHFTNLRTIKYHKYRNQRT